METCILTGLVDVSDLYSHLRTAELLSSSIVIIVRNSLPHSFSAMQITMFYLQGVP